jgi:hypothetical protein
VRRSSWVFLLLVGAAGCTGSTFSGTPDEGAGGAKAGNAGSSSGGGGGGRDGGAGGSSSGSAGQLGKAGDGGTSGTSGTSGTGGGSGKGNQGVSGKAGETGTIGESGNGGEGAVDPPCTDAASCPDGHYCNGQGVCSRCTDITSLDDPAEARFGTAEPLSVLNEATDLHYIRSPRVFGSGLGLIYVREFFGQELWLTGNFETDFGAPLASPIGQPDFDEGAALWLSSESLGESALYNLVFQRTPSAGGPSELYAAQIEGNGTAAEIVRLPAPFNAPAPTLESSFSMAVSAERAWWMVNRDSMLDVHFYTAPLDGSAPASVVGLRRETDCVMTELDLGAWVTPDGKLLFVNGAERDVSCALLPEDTRDVVVFKLDEAGQAIGTGSLLPDIHEANATEADASLSADMCWLYFTKMQDTGLLGAMRARREG